MPEFNTNLWAPWRMEYIRSLDQENQDDGCFLCNYWAHPEQDRENHVIWRSENAFVVMNRFPYTNGHLLIAFAGHKGDVTELSPDEFTEMNLLIRSCVKLLRTSVNAQGFNIGYNLGLCAGAGLPGHLHAHVVPRWSGDTNFMAVLGESRVIPDALNAMHDQLIAAVDKDNPFS